MPGFAAILCLLDSRGVMVSTSYHSAPSRRFRRFTGGSQTGRFPNREVPGEVPGRFPPRSNRGKNHESCRMISGRFHMEGAAVCG